MSDTGTLMNIGDLAKPANTLIEKIAEAIGGIARPGQIVRVAKAEAEAKRILAIAEVDEIEIRRRALQRFIYEEALKQENIESITAKAIPHLNDNAQPEMLENDWVVNFFDKSRLISDEEMQNLWAKVLAGEANHPGTYSKRTVNFIGSLDKHDAELFASFCNFCWVLGNVPVPIIYEYQQSIYNEQGINYTTLHHLDDIGLIRLHPLRIAHEFETPSVVVPFFYFKTWVNIRFDGDVKPSIDTGIASLTKIGEQLRPLCDTKPIPGFFDYVLNKWIGKLLVPYSPVAFITVKQE